MSLNRGEGQFEGSKEIPMKKMTKIAASALAVFAVAGFAQAEGLPEKPAGFGNRPLTMIVPFGPGGGSDKLARAMAEAMEAEAGLAFKWLTNLVAAVPPRCRTSCWLRRMALLFSNT